MAGWSGPASAFIALAHPSVPASSHAASASAAERGAPPLPVSEAMPVW